MKHIVTDLNDLNESVMFSTSILGNFCFEIFFGELNVELSPNRNSYMQSKLLHSTQIVEPHNTLVDIRSTDGSVEPTNPTYVLCTLIVPRVKMEYLLDVS